MTDPCWTAKQVEGILALMRSIRVGDLKNGGSGADEIDERLPGWEFHNDEVRRAEESMKPGYDSTEMTRIPPRKLDTDG